MAIVDAEDCYESNYRYFFEYIFVYPNTKDDGYNGWEEMRNYGFGEYRSFFNDRQGIEIEQRSNK
ncbi:hypothetical protein C900_00698 [Fulvivirga imtechensis AK7]|uniref:Uncharacterized protein n=1 Tax=Fulvivirga imtechensis AK7 TaxID=1237149 RepID=L8JH71_9BACT|nr:hypothetical protein C900_00698 [Fulvivirga imtechensis AK7]